MLLRLLPISIFLPFSLMLSITQGDSEQQGFKNKKYHALAEHFKNKKLKKKITWCIAIINHLISEDPSFENDKNARQLARFLSEDDEVMKALEKEMKPMLHKFLEQAVAHGNNEILKVLLMISSGIERSEKWLHGIITMVLEHISLENGKETRKKMLKLILNFSLLKGVPLHNPKRSLLAFVAQAIADRDQKLVKLLAHYCATCKGVCFNDFYNLVPEDQQMHHAITDGAQKNPKSGRYTGLMSLKEIAAFAVLKANINIANALIPLELKEYASQMRIKGANLLVKAIKHRNWDEFRRLTKLGADDMATNKYGTSAKAEKAFLPADVYFAVIRPQTL